MAKTEVLSKLKEASEKFFEDIQYIKDDEHFKKVFIFTSIDLVNSTAFKQENENWVKIFSEFYGIVKSEFIKEKKNVWKSVGDEILFYEEIYDINKLLEAPSHIFKLMEKCERILYDKMPESRKKIFLKAAVWSAVVRQEEDISEGSKGIKNVMLEIGENLIDFIGPDIDEGFRLSKYTSQNKLVLDSKIANLMKKYENKVYNLCDYVVEDRLRIVGYKKLKGIWNNRLYPIIWYHKNWSDPESMYLYDEYETVEIVNELKQKKYKTEPITKIAKIFDETGRKGETDLLEHIVELSKQQKKLIPPAHKNLVELHLVAVCIDKNTEKILVVQRNNRDVLNEFWEFGCAKARRNVTIEESVVDEYKDDFGINITLIKDENRDKDKQPIPIAVYSISKKPFLYQGIIFVATFDTDESNICIGNNEKHKQYQLLNRTELFELEKDGNNKVVNDFKDTIEKAYKLFDEYNKNKLV